MAVFNTKEDVFELIEKLDKSSLIEFEFTEGIAFSLKLSKRNSKSDSNREVYISESKGIPAVPDILVAVEDYAESKKVSQDLTGSIIKAPLIGTFYSSPSPDSEPYVKVGDKISKGMVICVIEAMKTMNEIESDVDGEIAEILVKNGSPVEYGQPLFRVI